MSSTTFLYTIFLHCWIYVEGTSWICRRKYILYSSSRYPTLQSSCLNDVRIASCSRYSRNSREPYRSNEDICHQNFLEACMKKKDNLQASTSPFCHCRLANGCSNTQPLYLFWLSFDFSFSSILLPIAYLMILSIIRSS